MNVVNRSLLLVNIHCDYCSGSGVLYSRACDYCAGAGVVAWMPPVTDDHYLAGSGSAGHFLARLLMVIARRRRIEQAPRGLNMGEMTIIESARRSGMAEVARGLAMWLMTSSQEGAA